MPRKEKEADSNHIGPSGPHERGVHGSWPSNGPRRGSPRPRCTFCKIAPSLPEYYAALPSTIAPEKPSPAIRAKHPPYEQAYKHRRAKTKPRAVI